MLLYLSQMDFLFVSIVGLETSWRLWQIKGNTDGNHDSLIHSRHNAVIPLTDGFSLCLYSGSRNVLEALTKGAQMATMLVSSIVVTMILYLSLTEFLNATLRWFGERVDVEDFTFEVSKRLGERVELKDFTFELSK